MSKRTLAAIVATSALVLGSLGAFALPAFAENTKVVICHQPGSPAQETKEVPDEAVEGHIGHGDTLGECLPLPPVEELPADPPADPTPYVLVAWALPGDVSEPIWPGQVFTAQLDVATGDLAGLDGQLGTCGIDYQVDLYLDDETTASLIAGGVLNGPSDPPEHLAYGAPGLSGNPWKYVDNAECEEPPVDVCPNIEGAQATIPEGLLLVEGLCVPPVVIDLCANIEGQQEAVPTGYDAECNPPTVQECETFASVVTTDLATWNTADTDSLENGKDGSGSVTLTEHALHVETADAGHRKAAGYFPADFPLSQVGEFSIDWTGTGSAPGGQLVVSLDGDATPEGILVIESIYGGVQWLSVPAGGTWVVRADSPHAAGGGGYPNQGTFNEWLAASPNARVLGLGFSLGSGVTGSGDIESITTGCTVYTFAAPVVEEPPVVELPPTEALAYTGTDPLVDWGIAGMALALLGIGGAALGLAYNRQRRIEAEHFAAIEAGELNPLN